MRRDKLGLRVLEGQVEQEAASGYSGTGRSDQEIYHRPPSMMIATVDKFALMAWRGEVRTLFGRANTECPRHGLLWPGGDCSGTHRAYKSLPSTTVRNVTTIRPPDLIIQDEFHLISGPLGTMVGLYETAINELCSWALDGKTVQPKIVASTATVRKGGGTGQQRLHAPRRGLPAARPRRVGQLFFDPAIDRSDAGPPLSRCLLTGKFTAGDADPRLHGVSDGVAGIVRPVRPGGGPVSDDGRVFQFTARAWTACAVWPKTTCRHDRTASK